MNKKDNYPKVLVISHNPFSKTQNNGKTLSAFFDGWPSNKIAQLFLTLDSIDLNICKNYYRVTDIAVLKSFIKHTPIGEEINTANYVIKNNDKLQYHKSKTYILIRNIFQRRSSFATLIRNIIWNIVKPWKNKGLNDWIVKFKPNLIFFQSSNVSAIFNLVNYISKKYNLPIITETTDDYVTLHFSLNPFYLIDTSIMKNKYQKLVNDSNCIFAISEMMAEEYKKRFGGNFKVAMNSIEISKEILDFSFKNKPNYILTYAGNIGLNRWKTLIKLAKTIDTINVECNTDISINIYTSNEITKKMNILFKQCACLNLKGYVDNKQLEIIRANSDFLIHVESFDLKNIYTTRLSISTKIPEYLLSKRCIIAIGPSQIASIRYIKENNIGYVIDSNDENSIKKGVLELFNDNDMIKNYIKNSYEIAQKNHFLDNVSRLVQEEIFNVVGDNNEEK